MRSQKEHLDVLDMQHWGQPKFIKYELRFLVEFLGVSDCVLPLVVPLPFSRPAFEDLIIYSPALE